MYSTITLNGVSYAFGANTVLNQLDLHIDAGSVVALLGPSGCGKSTMLRLLAGLAQPAQGEIFFGDRRVAKAGWSLPPEARDIGTRVAQALARVGLSDFADRKPAGLSGGQQQRVALARAIVAEPRVLLFDEPLSNLDSELRESLCHEMATLLRQLGTTAIYVTHDRREAELLADRIVHLSAGSVAADRLISSSGEFA